MGSTPYDRFAQPYNVTRVLNSDQTLNVQAFTDYSPLYLPGGYAVTYLIAFILSSCVIVHTILYYGHTLVNGFKRIKVEKDDIHAKLMRSYPEVPDWWYLTVFAVFLALMIVAQEVRVSLFPRRMRLIECCRCGRLNFPYGRSCWLWLSPCCTRSQQASSSRHRDIRYAQQALLLLIYN